MNKLLSIIPYWALGIGFLIFVIGFLCVIFFILKRGITVKNRWFSIQQNRFNPEAFILIFKESLRVDKEISRIEYLDRMKEQMGFVDDKIKEIRENILRIHRHILQAKGKSKSESENHTQIKILNEIMENMLNEMKSEIRDRFREMRRLFDMEENKEDSLNFFKSEFEVYYDRVSEALIQDCRENIRKRWIDHKEIEIGRRDSWDSIQEALTKNGQIGGIVKDMFVHAVQVQLKYTKEMKKLENEIDQFIKRIVGNDKK